MALESCSHGYDGNLFKCPQGCHKKDPVSDYEELDRNIDYFFSRLDHFESLKGE